MSEDDLKLKEIEANDLFDSTEEYSEDEAYAAGYMDGIAGQASFAHGYLELYSLGYTDGAGDREMYLLPNTCLEGVHRYTAKVDSYGMFAICTDCGHQLTKGFKEDILEA